MSKEYVCGNVFVRQMLFDEAQYAKPSGTYGVVDGHRHNFDHVSYIAKGKVMVELLDDDDNVIKTVIKSAAEGFNWVLIEAGKNHRLTSLEPGSIVHCIYAHRNPQGEVIEYYDGWMQGYV